MFRLFLSVIFLFVLVFFALRWSKLNAFIVILIFLSLAVYFAFMNAQYFYLKKMIFVNGIFKNGILKGLLSGKFISFLRSLIFGFALSFVILFNFLSLDKFSFLFIFILTPLIFLLIKFGMKFFFANEFRNIEFSRLIEIVISACILSLLSIFLPLHDNIAPSIAANFDLLRELYSFKILLSNFGHFLSLKSYIFNVVFIINQFSFYFAICYFVSLFFSYKILKIGYFIGTITTCSYIGIMIIFSLNLQVHQQSTQTKIHKIVKFIINLDTNESILLSKDDANEIKNSIDNYQNISINEIKIYIDDSFEKGARMTAKQIADFNFSVFADYIILFHSLVDDEKKYVENLLQDAIKKSFPPDMNDKIAQIIDKNFSLLNSEISAKIFDIAKIKDFDLQSSIGNQFLSDKKIRVSSSAGFGFGAVILAKVGAKSLAKFGSKLAASGSAATTGVACGAFAPLCSIGLAGATWISFDAIFAKGDEMLNRAKFEEEIYTFFMQEKDEILKNLYDEIVKNYDKIRSKIVY